MEYFSYLAWIWGIFCRILLCHDTMLSIYLYCSKNILYAFRSHRSILGAFHIYGSLMYSLCVPYIVRAPYFMCSIGRFVSSVHPNYMACFIYEYWLQFESFSWYTAIPSCRVICIVPKTYYMHSVVIDLYSVHSVYMSPDV